MGRRKKSQNKNREPFDTDTLACQISPIFGRHLTSKTEIRKGELLIKERWIVAGPSLGTTTSIVCIGCHSNTLGTLRCKNCGWYICSDSCSTNSPFHTSSECNFFSQNDIKVPENQPMDYGILTVMRSLILKLHEPESWNLLTKLQSHNEKQKSLPLWNEFKVIAELIRNTYKLGDLFTADEIFKICGILEVNGFEMGDGWSFVGIFPKSSMIAHDCVPNSAQSENIDEKCLEVTAIVDIPAGSPITLCYSASLEGTRWRQMELQRSKYFECSCTRCQDLTELGTHFSTLVCQSCKSGLVLQAICQKLWICSKCQQCIRDEEVDTICTEYKQLRKTMDTTVASREDFLKKCTKFFYPNHFIPFKTKFDLCLAYGHDDGFSLEELTPVLVTRKLDLCQAVMKVLDIICPGQSVARGNILYEIQAAQILTVRQCLANEKCSRRLLRMRAKMALNILNEAIDIFQTHYSLRMLAQNAREVTLVEMNEWFSKI